MPPEDFVPKTSALLAARNRIKALLNTVKRLEEERGLAFLRVEAAPAPPVDDGELARLLVGVLPRAANRELPSHVLAVALALRSGPLAVRGLRDALRVPQATASVWLKDAARSGVVELHGDEKDKRRTLAALSPKGLRYFCDVRRSVRPEAEADAPDDASEG
jgi:DNA-binding MarR family transcriptional regulator